MKTLFKTWLALSLLGLAAGMANAASLALIDPKHPQIVTGAFTDLKGHTDAGGAVALRARMIARGFAATSHPQTWP